MIRDDIIQVPDEPEVQRYYKITLFQSGLGMNPSFFDTTFEKLRTSVEDDTDNKLVIYTDYIDMSHFNCDTNSFEDETAATEFNAMIERILADAENREGPVVVPSGKTVVVRTYLNRVLPSAVSEMLNDLPDATAEDYTKPIDYDSIENQKKKLLYIINAIKARQSDAWIMLAGHSQGGLVNMEATIAQHNDIGRLVSISTPYAPVCMAKIALGLNEMVKITGNTIFTLMSSEAGAAGRVKGHYYEECVNTLASDDYFNSLKSRWNSLGGRPDLTVISGVAGHLVNIEKEEWYNLPEIRLNAFDGLVTLQEQTDITHADFVTLVSENLPCYSGGQFTESSCINSNYIVYPKCDGCTLPSMGLISAFLQSVCDFVEYFFENLEGLDADTIQRYFINLPLMRSIEEAASEEPNTDNIDEDFIRYYNLYRNDNSHGWIASSDKAVALLLEILENY